MGRSVERGGVGRLPACGHKDDNHSQRLIVLSTGVLFEVSLCWLAAHAHEARARDSVAAAHMLSVRPPGSGADVAPGWLVTEASLASKCDLQREQRVRERQRHCGVDSSGRGRRK